MTARGRGPTHDHAWARRTAFDARSEFDAIGTNVRPIGVAQIAAF
jgi:hypothetical protein